MTIKKNKLPEEIGMDNKNGFVINDRDRILRAWQNSTELVRDYQNYANEMQKSNRELAVLFAEYAEDEAIHASRLLELLQGFESRS